MNHMNESSPRGQSEVKLPGTTVTISPGDGRSAVSVSVLPCTGAMNRLIARMATAAIFILIFATGQNAWTQEVKSAPELVMVKFLQAFVAYDYETCRSLLAPGATITITRRYQGGDYQSQHQDARDWLDEVGATGVKEIEEFAVDILDTAGLEHVHGATVVLRFTAKGMTGQGLFVNNGFDTGSLIETTDGWRILHYSSFEDFNWTGADTPTQGAVTDSG